MVEVVKTLVYRISVDALFWVKSYVKLFINKISPQEHELHIALKIFLPENNGKYWDIGANHPRENSVTYTFYLLGWSGVTVEPIPRYVQMHKLIRKRDQQFCGVFSENIYELLYYFIPTQYSTISKLRYQELCKQGFRERKIIKIKSLDNKDIFEEVSPKSPTFLKIDIEGSDLEFLRQLRLDVFTPRVILVEGIFKSHEISNLITSFGYSPVKNTYVQGNIFVHESYLNGQHQQ